MSDILKRPLWQGRQGIFEHIGDGFRAGNSKEIEY